ncbi:MAG: hypothetical protein ACRYF9_25805 [Janthinobacterium lividum]
MKINLSPSRRDDSLALSVSGSTITINGEAFDFSQMADGDTLPAGAIASEWFVGDVHKADGELELTLILPLPVNYSPAQAFPVPLLVTADGPVALPQPLPVPEAEVTEEPQA